MTTTLLLILARLLFHFELYELQVDTLSRAWLLVGVAPPAATFALLCAGQRRFSAYAAFLSIFSCIALYLFVPVFLVDTGFMFAPLPAALALALALGIGSPLLYAARVFLRISTDLRVAGGQRQAPRLRGDTRPAALGMGPDEE